MGGRWCTSQNLPLAKRGGVLWAFLNRGRVMIADETQAGVFGASGAFACSPASGHKKSPRTLGSEGAGYRVSRGLGGRFEFRGRDEGEGRERGAGAKKNASRLWLAFHSREFVGGAIVWPYWPEPQILSPSDTYSQQTQPIRFGLWPNSRFVFYCAYNGSGGGYIPAKRLFAIPLEL